MLIWISIHNKKGAWHIGIQKGHGIGRSDDVIGTVVGQPISQFPFLLYRIIIWFGVGPRQNARVQA